MSQSPTRPNRPSPAATFPKAQTKPTDRRSAFAKARENAANSVNNLPFIGAEERERLYEAQSELWLHAVRLNTGGKFGERWLSVISVGTPEADKGALTLARNDYRDTLFGELANQLAADPAPIGPLILSKIITQSGQEAWDLIESDAPF
jgi:hypothetical protein